MPSFSLVDVASIHSNIPRSKFSEAELDRLADLILQSNGLVRPIILKEVGAEKYEVISGNLEYYAATRLREKAPRQGEMVNAIVVSSKDDAEAIAAQVDALKPADSQLANDSSSSSSQNLERITNLELRLEKFINESKDEQRKQVNTLESRLKKLEASSEEKMTPLEAFNSWDRDKFTPELKRAKIPSAEKLAQAIYDARNRKQQKKFDSYQDVADSVKAIAKGLLGEKRLLTIIDDWSRR